jgi:hypothetical protein
MNKSLKPDSSDGREPASHGPGPLAGVLLTFLFDAIVWFIFVFLVATRGVGAVNARFAVEMTLGFVAVGAILFWLTRRQGYHEFSNGVIIATSIVVLLSTTCWGLIGINTR